MVTLIEAPCSSWRMLHLFY